ncbi:HlyD family efflux transporter periplasmic adaptor subunit [Actinoplanes sp. LDG1-06]|uniref:HlyD family efflux transporter periplasmic adaptor subunit n=1 Tax=Paractinoplanes ovalisporus TaxID=2810368 RepID=A0ABS2A416_9ACTN|nr:peptidoglycan-binding protein [Actinoplanes ovalisporus]MBM2614435.1 HlyD family efflux transporter periplasmic adaptor subunit [Actinoplanes ovalisporus]
MAVPLAVVLLAGGGAWYALRPRSEPVAATPTATLSTTRIERTDLSDARMVPGTLGFGSARVVKGTGEGVLTRLPAAGQKVVRGTWLFKVNDQPVVVFYGGTPLFRAIDKAGLEGSDVREVRSNLNALGYRTWAARRDVADAGLLSAVKRWQKDLGMPAPGALRPGQVVVVTGPGRVDGVTAALGDPAAGPVLAMTTTTKVVSVPMSAAEAGTVRVGTKVTVSLPDGKTAAGSVTAISRTVGEQDNGEAPKVTVVVTPAVAKAVAAFDSAPVRVRFTTVARKNVLAVPVGALVALREGGYALQKPDGSLVAATTGVFARGLVEVSGAGLAAGTTVVTTP